jgi:hypothetical protein
MTLAQKTTKRYVYDYTADGIRVIADKYEELKRCAQMLEWAIDFAAEFYDLNCACSLAWLHEQIVKNLDAAWRILPHAAAVGVDRLRVSDDFPGIQLFEELVSILIVVQDIVDPLDARRVGTIQGIACDMKFAAERFDAFLYSGKLVRCLPPIAEPEVAKPKPAKSKKPVETMAYTGIALASAAA